MSSVECTLLNLHVQLDCKEEEVVDSLPLGCMKDGQLFDALGTGLEGSTGSLVGNAVDPLDNLGRPVCAQLL